MLLPRVPALACVLECHLLLSATATAELQKGCHQRKEMCSLADAPGVCVAHKTQ